MKLRSLIGIFFVSASTLCLEISLTRYFSISQQYHFAFLVVSIAFLGYGASGSFLSLFKKIHDLEKERFLAYTALLFSVTILLSYLLCNAIPFDFMKLSWNSSQIFIILLFYVLLSLPFFFAGAIISSAITRHPSSVSTIYFFDLLGAGSGTLLSLVVFLPRGDKGVIPILCILALTAALLFSPKKSAVLKTLTAVVLTAEAVLFLTAPSWMGFRVSPFKALPVALRYPEAESLFTYWNAVSRVDIIDSPAVRFAPGLSLMYGQTLPPQLGLSVDGGELNAVTGMDSLQDPPLKFLDYLPSSLPYHMTESPRVLILEPKGGLDVLTALYFQASEIKAIEDNPLITRILSKDLSGFSGHIYTKDNVHVASSNSRAALKKEKESYDLIVFSLADVFGSSSTGQYGFGEKYLYTMESFTDVIHCLSPKGIASMTLYLLPPARQEIRLLATWIESLESLTDHPEEHLMALRTWGTITYFIKKSPITPTEIKILKNFADTRLFDLVYYPGIKSGEANIHNQFNQPLYYNMTRKLLSPSRRKAFYKDYLFDILPVTDDRPFFYNFFKLNKIRESYQAFGRKWLPFLRGEFLAPILLIQALLVSIVLILVPVAVIRRKKIERNPIFWKVFFFFGLIGMSYIFVEITLIQKFILFLGHPLYSVALIIFILLFASGMGSLLSKKILGPRLAKNTKTILLFIAVLIISYSFLLPLLFNTCIGKSLLIKILAACVIVFPLGFMMGFPFPSGIRLLEQEEKRVIPWAWATNAFSSVVNSIAALLLAFWGGYHMVLIIAAGGYLLALPFLGFTNHGNKPHS